MKKKKEFFDQLADTWEDQSFPLEIRKRVAELVVAFGIKKGARVLDVGTGTGILHPYLLEAVGKSGKVFAFDYSLAETNFSNITAPIARLPVIPCRKKWICGACFSPPA